MLLPLLLTGCTSEGIVTTDDCPETITVAPASLTALTRNFICAYQKSDSGKILGGVCQSRDTAWFTGKCQRVYVYEAPSEVQCWGAHDHPTQDDQCSCDAGYGRNQQTHRCETCHEHSYANLGQCTCAAGYGRDPQTGACISQPPIDRGGALNEHIKPYPVCPDHSARYSDGLCYCDAGYLSSFTSGAPVNGVINLDHCWSPSSP